MEQQPDWVLFETTEDLLSLEVVKRYSKDEDFSYFAIHDDCLLEICDNGQKWWVVGYIEKPEQINLPQWKHKT